MAEKKKAFDWTKFTLRVLIAAPREKVWEAWTSGLARWFPVAGEIEPRKGGKVVLQFLFPEDKLEDEVISATKGQRIVFPFGSHGEQVEVRLRKQGGGTLCELTQSDMRTTAQDKVQMHMGCRQGWTFFLANLKAWLEHGVDLRSHDPKRSYRQGYINS